MSDKENLVCSICEKSIKSASEIIELFDMREKDEVSILKSAKQVCSKECLDRVDEDELKNSIMREVCKEIAFG